MLFRKKGFTQPYTSLLDLFERSFAQFGEKTALINHGSCLTYQQIDQLSKTFAAYLQQQGLAPGDRIALQLPNVLTYPVALIGALRAGLIVVNTNPLYTSHEMRHQFQDADIRAIVILSNFAYKLSPLVEDLKLKALVIVELGDLLGAIKGGLLNGVIKYFKRLIPAYEFTQAHSWKQALALGRQQQYIPHRAKLQDIALLQYTGGTTGVAKGAMLTHSNLLNNLAQLHAAQKDVLKVDACFLNPLPLYHIFAFTTCLLFPFKVGAKILLITNPKDLKGLIKIMKKTSFHMMTGVNTLFKALLREKDLMQVDFSACKAIIGGGMAIDPRVAQQWHAVTGTYLVEGYGLTEASPVVACNPIDTPGPNQGVGFPVPGTEVKVVDASGKKVAKGKSGELWVKGPQVMQGYWNAPKATKKVLEGGWLRTGDIAVLNKAGAIQLVDRKKEMINISGFNVYPSEIERIALEHPAIHDAGVVGIPDERTGEAIKLCIVLEPGEKLTEKTVRHYFREQVTGYKVPKHIVFLASLPKSTVGKVLRRALRDIESDDVS